MNVAKVEVANKDDVLARKAKAKVKSVEECR